MRYVLNTDVPYCVPVREVLRMIRKHKGKIEDFDPDGPGGGNPNIRLSFPSREDGMSFLRGHYPQDDDRFLQTMIETSS
jgi:hypothetical protein